MGFAALAFVLLPVPLIRLFNGDAAVLAIGVPLLFAAAVFQLFDGAQVAAIGALRGAGDTRSPLIWNLIGYWLLALPTGYLLCFHAGLGALGIWVGYCAGLIVCGVALIVLWARVTQRLHLLAAA
jgi:MATE family multidrug resistance protein